MSNLRASVVVLVWNGIEYLATCLDAVLAQEYPDLEVIVVDNGSTDGSPELVAERFPRVKLIRNERNRGFSAGNNKGLRTGCKITQGCVDNPCYTLAIAPISSSCWINSIKSR